MDFGSVDSVFENLFSAQNFFAMHEQQQQLDKQNAMMANSSLIDLDMFRHEDGGGDASGELMLGEDLCSSFRDSTGGGDTTGSSNNISDGVSIEPPTTSKVTTVPQQAQKENAIDDAVIPQDACEMPSSMAGDQGTENGCLWSWPLAAPTIQIGEEKYLLRTDTIFVLGMRLNVTKNDIIVFFGKMGHIRLDELTMKPKIFVYKNKLTGRSKGEATITYTSPYAAQAAINYLNGRKFLGQVLSVVPAYLSTRPGKSVRFSYAQDSIIDQRRQRHKKWKPAIDNWICRLCKNSNFVWRLSCNRCHVSRSETVAQTGGPDNVRPQKLDWICCYCFNVNFWYRENCNRCRVTKAKLQSRSESDNDKWEIVMS